MNRFAEIRKKLMEANGLFLFSSVPDKLFECRKCIPHLLPFCKQLIQNLAIGTGGVMQQHDAPGWIRPRSLSKASSLDGCASASQST